MSINFNVTSVIHQIAQLISRYIPVLRHLCGNWWLLTRRIFRRLNVEINFYRNNYTHVLFECDILYERGGKMCCVSRITYCFLRYDILQCNDHKKIFKMRKLLHIRIIRIRSPELYRCIFA